MLLYLHTSKTVNIYYVVSVVQFLFHFKLFYPVNSGGANQRTRWKEKNHGLSLFSFMFFHFLEMFLLILKKKERD